MLNSLFIGITSWNSELFLECCLKAIRKTTRSIDTKVVVFDNGSTDNSVEIALGYGVDVIRGGQTQANALNELLDISNARYTLLMHADTILLSEHWFDICTKRIKNDVVLISPEDIGCGPMTRNYGAGHPESSFLLFDTLAAKKARRWKVTRRRFLVPIELKLLLDFYGKHVTHNLVGSLLKSGKSWCPMQVMTSNLMDEALYVPQQISNNWTEVLGRLEYGLGNFYALDGEITHYHNWYDRISIHPGMKNALTTEPNNEGYPVDYINQYSLRFVNDFNKNRINLPFVAESKIK